MNLFSEMPSNRLLTQAEVAAILGISHRQLRRLTQHDRIPHVRVAGMVRFDPTVLASWLDEARADPPSR